MKALKINYLKGAITLFALCLIGTATAASNGNGNDKEKEKKEVKVKAAKALVNETWYFTGDASDNPELAIHYSSSSTGLPPCGLQEEVICQIQAPDDGTGKPKMNAEVDDTTVQLQIREANQSLGGSTPVYNSTVTSFRAE